MTKWSACIALIAICGIPGICLLDSVNAQSVEERVAISHSNVDTSNWNIYRNDRMGFTAKYPRNWLAQQVTGTGPEHVLISEPRQAGRDTISIQFWVQRNMNPRGMTIEQWYAFQLQGNKSAPSSQTVLGGRPAIRREYAGSFGRNFDVFTCLNATNIFEVTITQPLGDTQLNPIDEAILSTIQFDN